MRRRRDGPYQPTRPRAPKERLARRARGHRAWPRALAPTADQIPAGDTARTCNSAPATSRRTSSSVRRTILRRRTSPRQPSAPASASRRLVVWTFFFAISTSSPKRSSRRRISSTFACADALVATAASRSDPLGTLRTSSRSTTRRWTTDHLERCERRTTTSSIAAATAAPTRFVVNKRAKPRREVGVKNRHPRDSERGRRRRTATAKRPQSARLGSRRRHSFRCFSPCRHRRMRRWKKANLDTVGVGRQW